MDELDRARGSTRELAGEGATYEGHRSDLEKVYDVLRAALRYHQRRDEMNAEVHLAPNVRYSSLTVRLEAETERLHAMLGLDNGEG